MTSNQQTFSTRARKLKEGRANLGEINPETVEAVEPDSAATDSSSEDEEEEEVIDSESREKFTTDILSKLECLPDQQKDEWIAVDMGSVWYPAQFELRCRTGRVICQLSSSFSIQYEMVCLAAARN